MQRVYPPEEAATQADGWSSVPTGDEGAHAGEQTERTRSQCHDDAVWMIGSSGNDAPSTAVGSACSQSRMRLWYTLRKSTLYLRFPESTVLVSDGCSPKTPPFTGFPTTKIGAAAPWSVPLPPFSATRRPNSDQVIRTTRSAMPWLAMSCMNALTALSTSASRAFWRASSSWWVSKPPSTTWQILTLGWVTIISAVSCSEVARLFLLPYTVVCGV